jgi:hypothetical protein
VDGPHKPKPNGYNNETKILSTNCRKMWIILVYADDDVNLLQENSPECGTKS